MDVRSAMSSPVVTIGPTEPLAAADEKMQSGDFRHLPVVDASGQVLGMLARSDLRPHEGYLGTTRVDAVMTEPAVTVGAREPLEAATALLLEYKIGALPVLDDDGRLVGIITETDLLKALVRGLTGGEDTSARIDFRFTRPEQTFAQAVAVVEAAGATVLGLGTQQGDGGERRFFLRIKAPDPAAIAAALAAAGYDVERKSTV